MKLQQATKTDQYFLNLPMSLVKAKGWSKGDIIDIKLDQKGNLFLVKKEE